MGIVVLAGKLMTLIGQLTFILTTLFLVVGVFLFVKSEFEDIEN